MGLALITGIGFSAVFAFLVLWISELLLADESWPSVEFLAIDQEGVPLIGKPDRTELTPKIEYRTLDGTVQPIKQLHQYFGDELTPREGDGWYGGRWAQRVVGYFFELPSPAYWYLFDDDASFDGHGYFVGFDARSGLPIGFIGRDGYSRTVPRGDARIPLRGAGLYRSAKLMSQGMWNPFDSGMWHIGSVPQHESEYDFRNEPPPGIRYLLARQQILKVDFHEKAISPALAADDVLDAGKDQHPDPEAVKIGAHGYSILMLARRADRVVLMDPRGEPRSEYVLPTELREADFEVFPLPGQDSWLAVVSDRDRWYEHRNRLFWFDRQGTITRREEIELNKGLTARPAWITPLRVAACAPSPLILSAIALLAQGRAVGAYNDEIVAPTVSGNLPAAGLALAVALSLTVFAARRQRHLGMPMSLAWLAFVFLLGLPGFAGYLLHQRWPIREVVPAPAQTGCEVFA